MTKTGVTKTRSRPNRTATAYHEAGHAVAAWAQGVKVLKASIIPDAETDGWVQHAPVWKNVNLEVDRSARAAGKIRENIVICLAGGQAQRRYAPRSLRNWHRGSDYEGAVDLAFDYCGSEASASARIL
ncbi:MAG: hypothetical protein WA634_05010 [Silvibacterium sp.]